MRCHPRIAALSWPRSPRRSLGVLTERSKTRFVSCRRVRRRRKPATGEWPVPDADRRHVLGISGGKDSAALAVFMRDRVPGMEYFFCDTGKELPETYEYLQRLEVYLGKRITRLNPDRDFD